MIAEELGRSVRSHAKNLDVQIVLVFTMGGYSARMVSKYRPPVRIIACTPNIRVQRQMKLLWGTESILLQQRENLDALLQLAITQLHKNGIVKAEERIVVVRASALVPGKTNVLEVFTVNDVLQAKIS